MLFSEVYSAYFNTVAALINEAIAGRLTAKTADEIIREKAFSESVLTILPSIKNGDWAVINPDFSSSINNPPEMPMTTLQKRWLKTILLDPKMRLFDIPEMPDLADVKPLFLPSDIVYFDRYNDGDNYADETYIKHFRLIMRAISERKKLAISYKTRNERIRKRLYIPIKLEFSAKDDKFRLETADPRYTSYLSVARIIDCEICGEFIELPTPKRAQSTVCFDILDERNALSRVLLHFSDCKKETKRVSEKQYAVTLHYEEQDETEILIRILAFGPLLTVTAPERFIGLIKERINMQKMLRGD
jgi:hypothetical protein